MGAVFLQRATVELYRDHEAGPGRICPAFKLSRGRQYPVGATRPGADGLSGETVLRRKGKPNRHAFHDVGQAVANLIFQATVLGLVVHQMAGFYPDKVRELYGVPEQYEPVAAIVLGYPGDPQSLPERLRQREMAPRERRPITDFVFTGRWGKTSPLVSG